MSTTSLESRFCVAWTAEIEHLDRPSTTTESDAFSFKNMQFRARLIKDEDRWLLNVIRVEGVVTEPYVLISMMEIRPHERPDIPHFYSFDCQILSCEGIDEATGVDPNDWIHVDATTLRFFSSKKYPFLSVRFVFIFEEDLHPTSVRNDNTELPVQTESARGTSNDSDYPSNLDSLSLESDIHRMVSGLTEENCVKFLTVADAHGDVELKKSVIDYICSHKPVFKGDAWREFAKKQPMLAIEVYQSRDERET